MALKACRECKAEISTSAKNCPKCGAPIRSGLGFLGWSAVFFLGVLVLTAIGSGPQSGSSSSDTLVAELCRSAQSAVKSRLKAPATARFPDCVWDADEYEIRVAKDGKKYWVFGHVDSQNGFGALIRSKFGVLFERKTNGSMAITRVAIE